MLPFKRKVIEFLKQMFTFSPCSSQYSKEADFEKVYSNCFIMELFTYFCLITRKKLIWRTHILFIYKISHLFGHFFGFPGSFFITMYIISKKVFFTCPEHFTKVNALSSKTITLVIF